MRKLIKPTPRPKRRSPMFRCKPKPDPLLEILVRIELSLIHIDKGVHSIMATNAELKTDLDAVTAQVAKIGTETTATLQKVTDLEAALAAAGNTTPEVDAAMAALKAQVKVVDDMVADAAPAQ